MAGPKREAEGAPWTPLERPAVDVRLMVNAALSRAEREGPTPRRLREHRSRIALLRRLSARPQRANTPRPLGLLAHRAGFGLASHLNRRRRACLLGWSSLMVGDQFASWLAVRLEARPSPGESRPWKLAGWET